MSAPKIEAPEEGQCFFCETTVDDDVFCYGCRVFICEGCEAGYSIAAASTGTHTPEHHREEFPDD